MKLTRDQYRTIKSMDRESLGRFIESQRVEGYNLGVSDVSATLTQKIAKAIKETPGIGDKRYEEIMQNIVKEMSGGEVVENETVS